MLHSASVVGSVERASDDTNGMGLSENAPSATAATAGPRAADVCEDVPETYPFPIRGWAFAACARRGAPSSETSSDADVEEAGEGDVPVVLRIDRRREPRSRVTGEAWAQVLMCDPMRTLLGGAMRIDDIGRNGIAVVANHAVPLHEAVEIRLAPFRVRGRIGRVVRCEPMEPTPADLRRGCRGGSWRVVVAFNQATFAA